MHARHSELDSERLLSGGKRLRAAHLLSLGFVSFVGFVII